MIYILFTLIIVLSVFLYSSYMGVIKSRNQLDEALSGIDVQFKKRYELLPNILTIAQKFMTHEKAILEEITKLRTAVLSQNVGTKERFELEEQLHQKMGQFSVSVENYPDLKSSTPMVEAMKTYQDVEENIAAARRFYNSALRELKNKTQIFPGSLFKAHAGDVSAFAYFVASDEDKTPVKASDYLK